MDIPDFPWHLSRRDVIRLGSVGLAGLLLPAALSGCSDDAATGAGPGAAAGPLAPFDPAVAPGPKPGLPARIAFPSQSAGAFLLAMGDNMKQAAGERGVDYVMTIGDGNPSRYVDQLNQHLARGAGAIVVAPLDLAAQRSVHLRAIESGVCVMSLVATPATMVGQTDQYRVGYAQGEAAATYVANAMSGRATALYLNVDSQGPELQKRHKGVLEALRAGGGEITVAVDVEPKSVSAEEGFAVANSALQAHPEINVVLGGDAAVVGAYRAFEQAGKLTDAMYFGGIDGDPQALDLIAGGGPYRTSHGFAWQVLGYAYGAYAADWLEGRSVPRALLVPPVALTRDTIPQYNADMARAGAVFADDELLGRYIQRLGNVSFATKDQYWATDYSPS
jgi:ribose transport system substrate-binding protein